MKNQLVVPWLTVLAVGVMVVASCAIRHRSGEYACETTANCDDGRTCTDGLCVVVGDGKSDAAVGDGRVSDGTLPDGSAPDGSPCPSQCTSCDPGTLTCTIDCAVNPAGCINQVVCPAGWRCDIACSTAGSCRNGVNCLGSLACTVECSGAQACRNVACGPGPCDVSCSGNQSCTGVSCGQSCACDVACGGQATCSSVFCTATQCRVLGGGCSSSSLTCDTCP